MTKTEVANLQGDLIQEIDVYYTGDPTTFTIMENDGREIQMIGNDNSHAWRYEIFATDWRCDMGVTVND